jgi:hypothetical protein
MNFMQIKAILERLNALKYQQAESTKIAIKSIIRKL